MVILQLNLMLSLVNDALLVRPSTHKLSAAKETVSETIEFFERAFARRAHAFAQRLNADVFQLPTVANESLWVPGRHN